MLYSKIKMKRNIQNVRNSNINEKNIEKQEKNSFVT